MDEAKDLKVLMISSDRNILTEGSGVRDRMKEYAKCVSELHIILLSNLSHGLKESVIGENIWVYPTNSLISFLRPYGAKRMGKKIVQNKNFVRGKSVITADSIEGGWAGLSIKNRWRLPLEVQFHTDPFSPFFNGFQNNVRKYLAPEVIKAADTIRVVSESLKSEIIKLYPDKTDSINVLPIYIDKKRIESSVITTDLHKLLQWKFIILSVARLTPEKNIRLGLEVMKRLRSYFPDVGYVVVGSGPEKASLENLAKELEIDAHVAFLGWQEDVATYYKSSDLFLQTSQYEGYGLALVEAGLSNLPVVSTPVGIVLDLEDEKDLYICPQNDSEYMFKAIYDLIEHGIKRESFKINMRRSLDQLLISKEAYLEKLMTTWVATSLKIHE